MILRGRARRNAGRRRAARENHVAAAIRTDHHEGVGAARPASPRASPSTVDPRGAAVSTSAGRLAADPPLPRRMPCQNVFVVGLDPLNLRELRKVTDAERYRYHELLSEADVRGAEDEPYPFDAVLERLTRELEAFDGSIDAIIGYWDYPVAPLVALLAERFGTTAPSLASVVRCEHKYWSRLVQREAIDAVPDFTAFDPFADDVAAQVRAVGFPAWVKPVTGTGSVLGFRVEDEAELDEAVTAMRRALPTLAEGFDAMLAHVELPDAVAGIGGRHGVAEAIATGHQCTVSGYVYRDEVVTYGVVDSVNFPDRSSFQRYEYPSELPAAAQERMKDLTRRVIAHVGLRDATFNVEFFYDEDRDAVSLLEINPRMSQSHGLVYEMVDGLPNHELLVDLALGERPTWREGEGPHAKAAKCFIRSFEEDAVVRRVPTEDELAALRAELPDVVVKVLHEPGGRLSDLAQQEPHSYALAHVFVGARDRAELLRTLERVEARLTFELEPVPADA